MKGRLADIADAVGAELHGADGRFEGACIDTRRLASGALFFALPGRRVDGHEFVARAACLGAAAAVVSHVLDVRLPQLVVDDVEAALQRAGAHARDLYPGTVVGITGSNGKTTVKQMLAAILGAAGSVLATEGNLNNHLGVPLTLMRLDAAASRAVIEMGANHAGEIAALCALARPQVGVVTNAGLAHLEGFGSREGVARAKGELFIHLAADGIAVINADDDYADLWQQQVGPRRYLRFALAAGTGVDVHADALSQTARGSRFELHAPDGVSDVELPLAGTHNVTNALAAAAVAHALDIDVDTIAGALGGMVAVGGRLAVVAARHGARLVDDSYNANPDSLAAALAWLSQQPGQRWAVLGDMGELGDYTQAAHREAGTAAREAGIEQLWATGVYSRTTVEAFGDGGHWFEDHAQLTAALEAALRDSHNDVVLLVKGSRSAQMEKVADALRAPAQARADAPC